MALHPAPAERPRKTSAERTRRWRLRLRGKGLVAKTVWTFDLRNPQFAARLADDLRRMRDTPDERRLMLDLEQMAVEEGLWGEDGWQYLLEETSSSSS